MLNKKKVILGSMLGIIIGSVFGISIAMFTYNSSSVNNKLIAGDIYMRYKETSAINLSGAMPSSTYPTTASGNYFEFQIIGKNTNTTKDITYNIKLAYGDSIQGKDRIDDEHLLFKLVEVQNNTEVTPALVENQSYDTIPGATLYTTTIPKNTTNEITKTYRVYARISEEVVIGNTNQTYTTTEWNNLYASIKINVDGGFSGGSTPSQTNGAEMLISTYGTENAGGLVGINLNGELYDSNATGTRNNTSPNMGKTLENSTNNTKINSMNNVTTIREYRYSGVNEEFDPNEATAEVYSEEPVKNYIWFNNEMWRILSKTRISITIRRI